MWWSTSFLPLVAWRLFDGVASLGILPAGSRWSVRQPTGWRTNSACWTSHRLFKLLSFPQWNLTVWCAKCWTKSLSGGTVIPLLRSSKPSQLIRSNGFEVAQCAFGKRRGATMAKLWKSLEAHSISQPSATIQPSYASHHMPAINGHHLETRWTDTPFLVRHVCGASSLWRSSVSVWLSARYLTTQVSTIAPPPKGRQLLLPRFTKSSQVENSWKFVILHTCTYRILRYSSILDFCEAGWWNVCFSREMRTTHMGFRRDKTKTP